MTRRRRLGWIALITIAATIAVAGVASAESYNRTADGSTNDLWLEENEDVGNFSEGIAKFGDGVNSSSGIEELRRESEAFASSIYSFTFAGTTAEGQDHDEDAWEIFDGSDADRIKATILTSGGAELEIGYNDVGGGYDTCTASLPNQKAYSAFVKVDSEELSDTTVSIRTYKANGQIHDEEICTQSLIDSNEAPVLEVVPGGGTNLHELRVWDQLKSNATLDAIADPENPDHQQKPEGTETAFYRLEEIRVGQPGDLEDVNEIAGVIAANETVDGTENVAIEASFFDADHEPLIPDGPAILSVTRIESGVVEYWNRSTEAWQTEALRYTMERNQDSPYVFQERVGNLTTTETLQVVVTSGFTDETGDTFNATAVETVGSDTVIEIAGLDSSALIHLGIFGSLLIWSLWMGLTFLGFASTMPLLDPVLAATPFPYPFGFRFGVVAVLVAIWLEYLARNNLIPRPQEDDPFPKSTR